MIRKATEKDIPKIGDLLLQVDLVHHNGRPDIFKIGRKYNDSQLNELLSDPDRPILVSVDAEDKVAPLTDQALQEALQEQGYNVARRTVAKYREQLGIPVARLRKE